ncbi:MAG: tight adherence protein B [Bacteriovoracaceae bacterium]|jgi:tight adherence protein B
MLTPVETGLLTKPMVIAIVSIVIFLFCFKYSVGIFKWVEDQTFGTRSYIMEQLELLFIEFDEKKLTYILLGASIGSGVFVFFLVGVSVNWTLGFIVGCLFSFLGFKLPKPIINHMVQKRMKAYSLQMVDGLQLLANGLRAGLSVPQSLGMVVDELPPPLSQEFNMILQQNRIGVPLDECFEGLTKRMPTEDNDMFVASVNILRETGGNLAETFDTIVDVIRERVRLQQKIDTYVAQGMFQGYTIFAMPWLLGAVYTISDPASMMPLFTQPIGIIMLIMAIALDFVGLWVIMKVVKIKV